MAKQLTISQAINEALCEELARDNDVYLIGEDIGKMGGCYGVTVGIWDKFKDRVQDTPIIESAVMTMCVGSAMYGKRPVMEVMFADFASVAFVPMCMEAPRQHYTTNGVGKVPMVVRAPQGGYTSSGGHHSNCIEGWIQNFPGLKIFAPTNPRQYKGALKTAIRDNNPVVFLEHKFMYADKGDVPDDDYTIPFGKAEITKEGKDVTIVAWQYMNVLAQQAAAELEKDGVSVEIIDPISIRPFDFDTVYASVKKTGRCLVVYEHPLTGGFGAEIATRVSENCFSELKKPVARVATQDLPIPYGPEEAFMQPDKDQVVEAVKKLMK